MAVELTRVDHERLAEVCRRFGLDLFGSTSRGDDRDDSDVDLLYELAPEVELGWEIEDLATELEELLGRPLDLVSKRALHPALRNAVLGEACLLYSVDARPLRPLPHRWIEVWGSARFVLLGP